MKITKRVLTVLLLSALLLSCLLFTVSAEETFKADGISDIEDVLEYFEEEYFVYDDYEDGVWSKYYTENALNSEIVSDPRNSENNILKVTGPAKDNKYSVAVPADEILDTLVISFDIFYDSNMTGAYNVDIMMKNKEGLEDVTFTTFLKFDVKNGKLMNSVFDPALNNGEGAYVLTEYTDFVPAVDTWHEVVMFFNTNTGVYSFKIFTDGAENWHTSPDFTIDAASFSKVELKPYLEGRTLTDKISLCLDDVRVYSGTFERFPARQTEIVNQTIKDLDALYNADGTDNLTKMRIAAVFEGLKSAYTTDDAEIAKILQKATTYIHLAYADELIKRAEAIDTTLPYHDRDNFVTEFFSYSEKMPTDAELDSADGFKDDAELVSAVKAARALFNEEKLACDKIKADSVAFLLKMKDYDPLNFNYESINTFYSEITVYTDVDYTFRGVVEGAGEYTMEQAEADYGAFIERYARISASANAFISGTDKMLGAVSGITTSVPGEEAYEVAFGALSEGFYVVDAVILSVDGNVIDIDAELDEASIPDFENRNAVYFAHKASILENMVICDSFVSVMAQATAASYYTAQVKYFEEAKEIYDSVDINGRPALRKMAYGVVESVENYLALEAYIANAQVFAKQYVDAVAVAVSIIDSPTASFQDKLDAIANAAALKEQGDVTGIEGVAKANSDFSKYKSLIESVVADSNKLVALIPQITAANSFIERRALLVEAAKAAANSEVTLEGVFDALVAFEQYKAAYENDIAAMNKTHNTASSNALFVAGVITGNNDVYTSTDIVAQYINYANSNLG